MASFRSAPSGVSSMTQPLLRCPRASSWLGHVPSGLPRPWRDSPRARKLFRHLALPHGGRDGSETRTWGIRVRLDASGHISVRLRFTPPLLVASHSARWDGRCTCRTLALDLHAYVQARRIKCTRWPLHRYDSVVRVWNTMVVMQMPSVGGSRGKAAGWSVGCGGCCCGRGRG